MVLLGIYQKIIMALVLAFSVFLSGCLSSDLIQLAREYSASVVFFDHAQKNLRKIFSDCEYDQDCFQGKAKIHIEDDLCPKYEDYKFVSEKECKRAGEEVIALVLGNKELAVPIRNTKQDAHNDRMYELDQNRYERDEKWRREEAERQRQEQESLRQAEQQRQERERRRQAEQQRQAERQRQEQESRRVSACYQRIDQCKRTCYSDSNKAYNECVRDFQSSRLSSRSRYGGLPVNPCHREDYNPYHCQKRCGEREDCY